MIKPPKPVNEAQRLMALRALNLLDTEPEERFDRLTRMAKRMFQVPVALVTLVDEDRQWFKSNFGSDVTETPREVSFCGHAILDTDTFVIENTLNDPRFLDNPLVTGDSKVRFYAGTPIKTPDGYPVGTLCILDQVSRVFREEDIEALEDLARMVEKEIAAVQLATLDELTGISNRRGFYLIAEHSLSLCLRHRSVATLAVMDLNGFKKINDHFGHAEGDRVLKDVGHLLSDFFRESDLVGRFGGDEFAVLMLNTSFDAAQSVIARLHGRIEQYSDQLRGDYAVSMAIGMSVFDPQRPQTIHQLVESADAEMYRHKGSMKAAAKT